MTAAYFPEVGCWRIPDSALALSLTEMARDGRAGNEGVALWLGQREAGDAAITHVVALRGPGVIKRPAFLCIEPWLLNEVTDAAIAHSVTLIGQIHSHGPGLSTDLSYTDRQGGLAVPHYLSVVAPDYALRPGIRIEDCGLHEFVPKRRYARLTAADVSRRVGVVAGGSVVLLTVGADYGR